MTTFTLTCQCGHRRFDLKDQKTAEVLADVHEARFQRVAYRHNTQILEVWA